MAMPKLSSAASICAGLAPSRSKQLILAPVGIQHAVADEAEAIAHDDAELAHAPRDAARGRDHIGTRVAAANDLDQSHDVGRD